MFEFLQNAALVEHDFNQRIEFLIDGFLPKRMITLVYADGGHGKSWLAFAMAKYCAMQSLNVVYLDFDNPLSVLKQRNINSKLIEPHSNLMYIQRSKCPVQPDELLAKMSNEASAGAFNNTFVVLDSLRNFTEVNNDAKCMHTMDQIMNIREAGATVLIIHHSNKDGRNYQGSNNIRNSVDNMFQLKKLNSVYGVSALLEVRKERAAITDSAFNISPDTLLFEEMDVNKARLSDEDAGFIDDVKSAISFKPGINKSDLLDSCGFSKDDKTARARLDEFDGVHWKSQKLKNRYIYNLVEA